MGVKERAETEGESESGDISSDVNEEEEGIREGESRSDGDRVERGERV